MKRRPNMIVHGEANGRCEPITTSTSSASLVSLLKAEYTHNGVALTRDEIDHLKKAYLFDDEHDQNPLIKAGDMRTLFRLIERDGVRVVALLSQHLEPGEDPVKLLLKLLNIAGFDCTGDL